MMRFLFCLLCFPIVIVGQTTNQIIPGYKIVKEMPQFGNCGMIKALSRSACFQHYICTNLPYPIFAEKHGVKRAVIIYFEINETGKVENAKIPQDIRTGCGTASLNLVNAIPDWMAGKQKGVPVSVAYQLKVDYRPSSLDCR